MSKTNYTQEQWDDIRNSYLADPTRATVETLAERYDRTVRSIVGKLSKEGFYKKPEYRTKLNEIPCTKEQMVEMIAKALDTHSETLDGLEKAPKSALRLILNRIDPESLRALKVDDPDA
jgi:hypothetical protein